MWNLKPEKKIDSDSSRSVPLANTMEMLANVIPKVPITRISDLTPLDKLGLPTFSAITPFAKDLTIHMGKGVTKEGAKIGAIMEAVERVSAESVDDDFIQIASYHELKNSDSLAVANPEMFLLPADSRFEPHGKYGWLTCHELISDAPVMIASDFILSPPEEKILPRVDTNGLASGNTLLEAVNHALCEVIERDAISQFEFLATYGDDELSSLYRNVMLSTLPEPVKSLCEKIEKFGLHIVLMEITTDVSIPTFRAVIVDPAFPSDQGPRTCYFPGSGTHPNSLIATQRAVTEAVQSRLAYIQGARDAFNVLDVNKLSSRRHMLRDLDSTPTIPFASIVSYEHGNLMDELQTILDRLIDVNFDRVFVSNLTKSDLNVPVVRVRVPGLSRFSLDRSLIDQRCSRHLV